MNLNNFNELSLFEAMKSFFQELNVPISEVTEDPANPEDIVSTYFNETNEAHSLIDTVYFLGMVNENAFDGIENTDSLDSIKASKEDYDGLLIFGIQLKNRENGLKPTRSQLAEITRLFNREYNYTPVTLIFKYGEQIAFANSERLKYKQEWREGEKVGKISLLRDIDIENTHAGHIRILQELKIPKKGKNAVDTFEKLYKYWQNVFSVSLLNKKFYKDLSNWYFWAIDNVIFPNRPTSELAHEKNAKLEDLIREHNATNIIRLLTRILFTWFIKEKKLIPEELFDLKALQQDILNEISPYHDADGMFAEANKESVYYKAILQNLFFASLNCPIEPDGTDNRKRGFRGLETYGKHRGIDWMMRYKKYFKNPDTFLKLLNDTVPFLNGGLFECLDDKSQNLYIDGFSDQMTKGELLVVPDYLFFGMEETADISEISGIKDKKNKAAAVKGLINILKSYKFTITENTPIEEDIELDPELLGKVFENLLASYNPETKTTARKQTGSFYTPREIVNYMVDESLIAYLKNQLTEKLTPTQISSLQKYNSEVSTNQFSSLQANNPEVITNQFSSLKGGVPEGGGGQDPINTVGEPGRHSTYPAGNSKQLNNLPYLKTFRKELRNNLTPAEAKLWSMLKNKQLDGKKFRRQHSFANYILDFYCPEEKLAVELDGQGHFEAKQAEYDRERDLFMEQYGIKVIRFENKWVWDNAEGLLDEIRNNFGWYKNPSVRHGRTAPLEKGEQPVEKQTGWSKSSEKENLTGNGKSGNENQSRDVLDTLLHQLISYDNVNPFAKDKEATQAIVDALDRAKILDPACGSGAFPMGVLQKMVHMLQKLDPDNELWREVQLKKAMQETEAAYGINDKTEREQKILDINEAFDENVNDPDYARKLYLIENCIYGVDIQPIATQISKLRFFISLVVDQKVHRDKVNFGIKPLPNLETRFVTANTLIGIDKPNAQTSIDDTDEVKELKEELKSIRHKLFNARTKETKLKYRNKDKELRNKIAEAMKQTGWQNDTAEELASWDPYDQNLSSSFFDPEWMFDIKNGFDVVIGNPPYLQVSKGIFSKTQYPYSEGKDKGKQNLYKVFVEATKNISKKESGTACLIVQSSLLCDLSSQYTREMLLKETSIIEFIEFPKIAPTKEGQVFENVLQGTCVYRFTNKKPNTDTCFRISINNDVTTLEKLDFEHIVQSSIFSLYPNTFYIPLVKKGDFSVIKLANKNSIRLNNLIQNINQGDINLTSSKSFFTTENTGIKLYRGKNVQRFYLDFEVDEYLKNGFKTEKIQSNSKNQFVVCQEITGTTDKYRLHF